MSLNEIKLPPQLMAQLYTNSLIGDADKPTEVSIGKIENDIQQEWKSLGNNKRQVLVVVDYAGATHLPDAQLEFLTQLLKACGLSLNDVAIINLNNYKEYNHSEVLSHFIPMVVLLFDISAVQFGFPFEMPQYQVQQFTGYTVMHAPALHDLQNDKLAKGKLWASLKKIFNL